MYSYFMHISAYLLHILAYSLHIPCIFLHIRCIFVHISCIFVAYSLHISACFCIFIAYARLAAHRDGRFLRTRRAPAPPGTPMALPAIPPTRSESPTPTIPPKQSSHQSSTSIVSPPCTPTPTASAPAASPHRSASQAFHPEASCSLAPSVSCSACICAILLSHSSCGVPALSRTE